MKTKPRSGVMGLILAGLGLILAGVAISLVFFSGTTASQQSQSVDFSAIPASVSYEAPSIVLKDLQGTEHALTDYRGQIVLVNLWATWCPPCTAEMPGLQRYYERHRQEGFTVVAIEDGDPRDQVEAFVSSRHLTFPIWLDPTFEATDRAFKTSNLPSSYVVDRTGITRLVWFGAISEPNLERYVTPLMKE